MHPILLPLQTSWVTIAAATAAAVTTTYPARLHDHTGPFHCGCREAAQHQFEDAILR